MSSESPLIRSLQTASLQEHVLSVTEYPIQQAPGKLGPCRQAYTSRCTVLASAEKPTRTDAQYVVHQTHPANTPGPS